jgi:hypothetical protein
MFGCASVDAHLKSAAFPMAPLPKASIDRDASEFIWEERYWPPSSAEDRVELARVYRNRVADGLDSFLQQGLGESRSARYRLVVEEAKPGRVYMGFPCLLILTVFGCPVIEASAKVQLELQINDQIHVAIGKGNVVAGWYYNSEGPGEYPIGANAAIANAIADALLQIRKNAPAAIDVFRQIREHARGDSQRERP